MPAIAYVVQSDEILFDRTPPMPQFFSTRNAPRHSKVAYWNALHQSLKMPLFTEAADSRDFEGELIVATLATMPMVEHLSPPVRVERRGALPGADLYYFLHLIAGGRGRYVFNGHDMVLNEGDFAISGSEYPLEFHADRSVRTLALAIPKPLLERHLQEPEEICGLPIDGGEGLGRIAGNMLVALWEHTKAGAAFDLGPSVADPLLEMFAATFAQAYGVGAHETARRRRRTFEMRQFIETRLRDHELTPGAIADWFAISPRYLHMMFSGDGETVSRYILRRRLEECARRLESPFASHETITSIALGWGFNNIPHFTRAFKKQFGVTPTEYRRRTTRSVSRAVGV
jgi:AraC family transcriptional regulator, positive regulator of tynA and feaB